MADSRGLHAAAALTHSAHRSEDSGGEGKEERRGGGDEEEEEGEQPTAPRPATWEEEVERDRQAGHRPKAEAEGEAKGEEEGEERRSCRGGVEDGGEGREGGSSCARLRVMGWALALSMLR